MKKPWDTEPDDLLFDCEGLKCVVHRHQRSKHLCGYVGVSQDHPLFKVGSNEESEYLKNKLKERMSQPFDVDKMGVIPFFCAANSEEGFTPTPGHVFEVHGGITFANFGYGPMNKEFWYFGFDCAHYHDLVPSMDGKIGPLSEWEYRDFNYVIGEVKNLARQIALISSPDGDGK